MPRTTFLAAALAALLSLPAAAQAPAEKPLSPARHLAEGGDEIAVGVQPRYLLQTQYGNVVTNQDFAGQFQLITFGYTACPDVCPTTLAEMAAILEQLGEAGKRVQPIFISVDPERDTAKVLGNYVAFFNPRILGLTGSPALVRGVADNFKVRYEKVREPGSEQYWVDHSAGMYLLGPDSDFLAKFAYTLPAGEVAGRIKAYLDATPPPVPREARPGAPEAPAKP